jgi:hypothetical protein
MGDITVKNPRITVASNEFMGAVGNDMILEWASCASFTSISLQGTEVLHHAAARISCWIDDARNERAGSKSWKPNFN